jgi:hypothetical protein
VWQGGVLYSLRRPCANFLLFQDLNVQFTSLKNKIPHSNAKTIYDHGQDLVNNPST